MYAIRSYYEPGLGTESAAFLLYALVKMLRPRTALEA